MKPYLITYDLRKPGRDYQRLYDLLGQWRAVRLAESVWLAQLTANALEVAGIMHGYVDPNDRLAVVELQPGLGWGTVNAFPAGAEWLSRVIAPRLAA